ncbi:MAG: hypothetical protein A2315_12550 [Ignavibacteria bacterium RIFOXYB2_FULL_35_12]|nr:MAG: hypothetical protein A2X60_16475 [Ignavibacteria bacterium GWF2_35_20]OGU88322.1 MAG: hypothetical protein A2492_08510 [Ignavibacteria bacterium RIFOXYC12_FULL_35_11]OGU91609.1 MAG: hypothetical protein A3K31_02865 [Ignavibacteria bacterium RIFOXYA12_FULL_35_25]OGU97849.1 MAG: hypothetical protein A2347_16415 [Ignavibacteria bacterium RIFOXYB12_FULL_35_14]OGV00860.1 MAG: hypothetical protein A2455_05370 [Ignavibacteria bacterium RIFOXYC2_FULL_35_16]OGV04296.1 MAG: hypothetical protein 
MSEGLLRRNEQEQKWYFSVSDVVEALTDSTDIKQYLKRLRQRDELLNSNWGTICTPLDMITIYFIRPRLS